MKHIKTYSSTDLLIETKVAGTEWPRHYGEFGPVGYQHHRVFKLSLYTPPEDEDGEGAMSPWTSAMFGYKATLGDLRQAVSDVLGTAPGAKICKLGVQNSLVNELLGDDSMNMSDLRHPLTVINGERLYVADAHQVECVETAAFKAAATGASSPHPHLIPTVSSPFLPLMCTFSSPFLLRTYSSPNPHIILTPSAPYSSP